MNRKDSHAPSPARAAASPGAPPASPPRPPRASTRERLFFLVAAVLAATVLALAFRLEPDPRGLGTHERLGLPPCGFQLWTDLPCPSCGMTTAFALAARGRLAAAAITQPAGFVIFLVAVAFALAGPPIAALGVPIAARVTPAASRRAALSLLLTILLAWAFNVLRALR